MSLDKTPAKSALEVSDSTLDELLREFVELSRTELDHIRQGLEGHRTEGLDRWAHSIRGMAANLRLDDCVKRASRLEEALLSRDGDRITQAILLLEQAIEEVREASEPD